MGALLRHHDWSASPLGAPAGWSASLKLMVRMALNSPHPMFVFWGPQHVCLYNDAYRASIGPEKHPAMLGQPGRDWWAEIWDDVIFPQIQACQDGRPPLFHENQLVPIVRNGAREDVYWTYSYSPIHDPDAEGGIGGVVCFCHETTAQVRGVQSREAALARFQTVFDQSPGFVAFLNGPDHRFRYANRAFQDLVGGRAKIGQAFGECVPDEPGAGLLELLTSVFRSGSTFGRTDHPLHAHDGPNTAPRRVDLVVQPTRAPDGTVDGIFIQGFDVTARARAEKRALDLVERMDEALIVFDRDFRIIDINAAARRLGRLEDAMVMGRSCWELWPQILGGAAERSLREAMEHRRPVTFEFWHEDQGIEHCLEVRAFPSDDGLAVFAKDISDRRAREQAVMMAAAELRATAEAVPGLMWVFDDSGAVSFANDGFARFAGVATGSLPAGSWLDLVHPDELALVQDRWARARSEDLSLEGEFRLRSAEGAWVWHLVRLVAFSAGDTSKWIATATDIDDRRRLELSLRESQAALHKQFAELEAIYNSAPVGLCVLDAELRYVRVNERMAAFNGVPAQGHIGRTIQDIVPTVHAEAIAAAQRVLETGEVIERQGVTGTMPDGSGRVRHWRESWSPLRAADGAIIGVTVVAEELTQRLETERNLADSDARFRMLADNIDQLVWTADTDGAIRWFNQRWHDYTGVPHEQAVGWGWRSVLHPADADDALEGYRARVAEGTFWEDTIRLRSADGGWRWFLSRAHPIRHEDGTVRLWFGTSTDITQLRQTEEARALLAREVDHRAKNALAICQSIVRMSRAPTQEDLVEAVSQRIAAMARAQTLLSDARWEGCALRRAAEETVSAVSRGGRLVIEGPDLTLKPDAVQSVVLVLHELATNAVRHGAWSRRDGTVRLAWRGVDGRVELTWDEHGGPEPVPAPRAGFGTTMMRQLVEAQLRGEYRADWSPGGARVTIRLPDLVFLSRIVLSPPATGPRKGEDGAARSNPRGCVLVVEDMALLAFDIAEALRRSDWTVVGPAASVADGIALARGFGDELDCAVLDFDLSGVRSTPVAEVLRAAGVPIVWCTGFEASALDRLPEEAHLQKPIDHEQLLATVERHRPQRLPPAAH